MTDIQIPENQDSALNGLAYMLFDNFDPPTYRRELFNKTKMDFSIKSLKNLHKYINTIKKEKPESPEFNFFVSALLRKILNHLIYQIQNI